MNQRAPAPLPPATSSLAHPPDPLGYYGLPLDAGRARGVRLVSPTDDPCSDRYARPLARGLARLCDERCPDARVVAIDLAARTGNVLYHLARSCDPLAAIGYSHDDLAHSLSVNNLRMLGETRVKLRQGNAAALLRRDLAAFAGQDHVFVIHVALPTEGGSPLAEALETVRACLVGERVLIAILADERALRELGTNLELVACLGAEHGAIICTLRPDARATRALTHTEYQAGFDEFLRRTPQTAHHLQWLREHLEWDRIERVLSIGCGEAELELALAEASPALELVCVEPNPAFADAAEAKARTRAPAQLRCVREAFETVDLDALGRFDLVLISHSLYYMRDQPEQLSRAFSRVRAHGELLIFHLHPEANLRRFQRRFSVHSNYTYCADDVARDLAERSLMFTSTTIDIPTRIDDYRDELTPFLMERRCSDAELAAVRDYFAARFDAAWPNRSEIFRVPGDQSVPALDDEGFARCFAAFCERSSEYVGMRARLQRALVGRRSLLSIGCGDGRLELPCLRSSDTLTRYRGLDPNGAELADFRAALERAPLAPALAVELAEAGLADDDAPEQHELVLISHVLYYVEDKAAFMREALARVAPGGTCLLFHQTNIGINSVQARFASYNHRTSSHEVQDLLDSLGVRYRMELIDAHIDVSELPDELIHFFLERQCSPEELARVRSYFAAEIGDALYHPVCAFVIEAPVAEAPGAESAVAPSLPDDQDLRDVYLIEQRSAQPREVEVAGLRMWEAHNVFSPAVGLTSAMMARALTELDMFRTARGFVDVGTGTGLLAIAAARAGARDVVAVDIHPPAVACALYNVQRHGLREAVEVCESDLLTALGQPRQRFCAGAWNQPFYRTQDGLMGLDQDVLALNHRFLAEVAPAWFRPGAPILMAYSTVAGSVGGPNDPRPLARALGYEVLPLDEQLGAGPPRYRHQIFALLVPEQLTQQVPA